jgi:hypothetical protein
VFKWQTCPFSVGWQLNVTCALYVWISCRYIIGLTTVLLANALGFFSFAAKPQDQDVY